MTPYEMSLYEIIGSWQALKTIDHLVIKKNSGISSVPGFFMTVACMADNCRVFSISCADSNTTKIVNCKLLIVANITWYIINFRVLGVATHGLSTVKIIILGPFHEQGVR